MKIDRTLAVAIALLGAANLPAADERVELFKAYTGGYAIYRIPALVVTPQQDVLAACEARVTGHGDWDQIDLLIRRSHDGGRTWDPAGEIAGRKHLPANLQRNPAAVAAGLGHDGAFTFNNPTWIGDSATGQTHLLYCAEYERAFIVTTRDGFHFSVPREITNTFETFRQRDGYRWKVIALGPGHGIRLSTGRLVAPVWLSTAEGGHAHRPSACATIFSDDHGVTWHAGEIVARDPEPLANPSECAMAEVAPGRVLLSIRSESPRHRRALAWSENGADHWTVPAFQEQLLEPVCMAALGQLDPVTAGLPALTLLCHPEPLNQKPASPDNPGWERKNLTVRGSADGGKTWPYARVIEPGPSAYSDVGVLADRTVLILFETGNVSPYEQLTLVRLNRSSVVEATR